MGHSNFEACWAVKNFSAFRCTKLFLKDCVITLQFSSYSSVHDQCRSSDGFDFVRFVMIGMHTHVARRVDFFIIPFGRQ